VSPEPITARQFHEADGVEDWRVVGEGVDAYFRTGSFAAGARFVQAIGELPGFEGHRGEIDLRPQSVTVRLFTFAPGPDGLSVHDVELARQVSAVARELGVPADPSAVQSIHLSMDVLVRADVMPFWRAVLGYVDRADVDDELNDPGDRWPTLYLNQMDAPRPQRNRIHLDVWVPPEQAEGRVAAAVAAGGHLVSDATAPGWWILADAEGNEACVCTRYSSSFG